MMVPMDQPDRGRQERVFELLEHNVLSELRSQTAIGGPEVSEERLADLAGSVVAEILYAFRVDWDPDWVRTGQLHSWHEGSSFFARCPTCLIDSPPRLSDEEAQAWVREHEAVHAG